MTLIIAFLIWTVAAVMIGYKTGKYINGADTEIQFKMLNLRQAAKWLLIHERRRHLQDIKAINSDLEKLNDVDLPEDVLEKAGKVRFEV